MSPMVKRNAIIITAIFLAVLVFVSWGEDDSDSWRTPENALELLKEGNERFVAGESIHPNTSAERLVQAGSENQGDHAIATVISCSDSRVPVERIFDAGIMDIFVIRIAGNVVQTDEAGSIEYGLAHVNTPVLVVLGHTQCGAVTAVTHAVQGHGHALERNIPALVAPIAPAVKKAMEENPDLRGDEVIPDAIVANVWQGVRDLFMVSPATRQLVKSGKVKVVGAIYHVDNGEVEWLNESIPFSILREVERDPKRALNAMAENTDEKTATSTSEKTEEAPTATLEHSGKTPTHDGVVEHDAKAAVEESRADAKEEKAVNSNETDTGAKDTHAAPKAVPAVTTETVPDTIPKTISDSTDEASTATQPESPDHEDEQQDGDEKHDDHDHEGDAAHSVDTEKDIAHGTTKPAPAKETETHAPVTQ